MTFVDLIINFTHWLFDVRYYWLFFSLLTFLITTNITRNIFKKDLKDLKSKDWLLCIFLNFLFPLGIAVTFYILFNYYRANRVFYKLRFLVMNMTEIKNAIIKNVKFLGIGDKE